MRPVSGHFTIYNVYQCFNFHQITLKKTYDKQLILGKGGLINGHFKVFFKIETLFPMSSVNNNDDI